MSTFYWVVGILVALIGTHAFAYWRGAVAGEARAREQAQQLIEWAEREGKELGEDAAEVVKRWVYRLKGRLGL